MIKKKKVLQKGNKAGVLSNHKGRRSLLSKGFIYS